MATNQLENPHQIELQPSSSAAKSKLTEKDKLKEGKASALFAGIGSADKKANGSDDSEDERKKKKKAKKD